MYFLIGIVFLLCGGLMLVKPRIFYDVTENWKNAASGEPSKLYLFSARFGGIMVLIVGIACIVVSFL